MALTAAPYLKFIENLGKAQFNFTSDTFKIALLTASYTPNQNTHEFLSDVNANEVSSSGTGYTLNGITLTGVTWTLDTGVNKRGVFAASGAILWSGVTLSTRYAVVYKATGSAATSRLICWIDFGATKTYTAEDISMSLASGIVRIKAV